jgi:alpha-mannosidase
VLFNEFHDILPGSGIHINYVVADQWYDSAWATLDTVTTRALSDLGARLDTRGAGARTVPVVVFNALPWPRSGLVRVPLPKGDTATFLASDVPSLGARVYAVRAGTAISSRQPAPSVGPDWVENAYLRVEIDTTTGEITRLYDRRHRREALAPGGRAPPIEDEAQGNRHEAQCHQPARRALQGRQLERDDEEAEQQPRAEDEEGPLRVAHSCSEGWARLLSRRRKHSGGSL